MPAQVDRYVDRIDTGVDLDDCWEWQGAKNVTHGYGKIQVNKRTHNAHRIIYEVLVGPIPDGLVVDHLCRNKLCVNPDHLEPVTWAENIRRGIHTNQYAKQVTCIRGHDFDYITPDGRRQCKTCAKLRRKGMS